MTGWLCAVLGASASGAEPEPSWPAPGAPLEVAAPSFPGGFRRRIFLDAGHGAQGNEGALSCTCEPEESFTLRVAEDLGRRLSATGRFLVRQSRRGEEKVPYEQRVRAAEAFGADAMLSLHFDARGVAYPFSPWPGKWCYRGEGSPGFAVLWSEEGPAALQGRRRGLAQALSDRLRRAGFLAYGGEDYEGHYVPGAAPGVFVNRPGVGRRIYLLRKPRVPSVIIETHHGLDLREAARWREGRTLEAFASAVSAALVEALAPGAAAAARR